MSKPKPLDVTYEVPFNGLTAVEAERLHWLQEECAEVIMAVAKILRHGYDSRHPESSAYSSNRNDLEKELGHVFAAADFLAEAKEISPTVVRSCEVLKLAQVMRYMHHQPDRPREPQF